jgi:glycerophosphoryl diester phosphodiesterase
MFIRRCAATLAVILLVGVVAWVTLSQAPLARQPRDVTIGAGPPTAGPAQPPTDTTPLLGDFDGDHRTDLFWYGPGAKDDHLWLGRPDGNFVGVPVKAGGPYVPLVGDFDGDGAGDILWYGPGGARDRLWLGRPDGGFSDRAVTVTGSYQPLVGDFNGDRRSDVFWYRSGVGPDVVWYGHSDGNFSGRTVAVRGNYQPLVGNFNGDGAGDILWYGPGGARDRLWLGRPDGGFSDRAVTVTGSYQPLVGDFNGDRSDDILWYGPDAAPDMLWSGHADGRFTDRAITVRGTYQPFTGDFDGDGRHDIFWYRPAGGHDLVWYGRSDGRFTMAATAVHHSYRPVVGDFGGDGADDVLWWAPGPANDVLWTGQPDRRFTDRSTTVDLDYSRARPIRQESLEDRYDPYGFVAHAFGATVDHQGHTNSLEAFQRNYRRGFRVFEADQVLLADGTVLVAHDGLEAHYGLDKHFREATWADVVQAGRKYDGTYTVLRSIDLLRLMLDHPDMYVILDPKGNSPEIYGTYVRQATRLGRPDLLKRIMPHITNQEDLDAFRAYYPLQNYVLALYRTQYRNEYDDAEVIDFVRRNRTPAVMMWWHDRDPSISLAANHSQHRRFRRKFVDSLRAAGAVVYVHSLRDPVKIRRFWDLGVGVYSDEPFPVRSAAASRN